MVKGGASEPKREAAFVVTFKPEQRTRLQTLRSLGLLSAESSSDVARMQLDRFIEDLAARNNLTVLDLDALGEKLASGASVDALKRVGIPAQAGESGKRKGDEKR